jgi:DNA-binding HxlR family transcriptional regulator
LRTQEGTEKWYSYFDETIADNEMNRLENIFGKDEDLGTCPVRSVLDRIGDKWSILIIMLLGEKETMRFNELSKEIGDISQKMLTVTLRSLEADGLVIRTIYPQVPPRVDYEITPLGKSLVPHIISLSKWATQSLPAIKKSRARFEGKA